MAPRIRSFARAALLGDRCSAEHRLDEVLGEAVTPGIQLVTLLTRTGLQIGSAGNVSDAAAIAAITSNIWQTHEKSDLGSLACMLLENLQGRLAIKDVGNFIIAICADNSVPFGSLKAKVEALHDFLQKSLLPGD